MVDDNQFRQVGAVVESARLETLRVISKDDPSDRRVVKRARQPDPAQANVLRLRRDYELVSRHRLRCMLPALEVRAGDTTVEFHFRDLGGLPVESLRGAAVDTLLAFADHAAAAIGELQEAGIVCRDIRPTNLLVAADHVVILDFGSAVEGEHHRQELTSAWALGAELAYAAPENTGRTNRSIDFRSDLYGLGVVLYELIVGDVPFRADDPLDLVYMHLAVSPTPPDLRNPAIGPFLSGVVMRLLAKDPEERYQSVAGLRADLHVARALCRGEPVVVPEPGALDVRVRFRLSDKLYGRDAERDRLLASLERACGGKHELVLMSGYSGVGKTSLIRETYLPITRSRAFFVSGKFDQLSRSVPYGAWIEALTKLIDLALMEPDERLAEWRLALTSGLGEDARALAEVVPSLTMLLGPLAPSEALPPADALDRFNRAVAALLRAFSLPGRPVVIFLDDLQWADSASLGLLQQLVHGGYRDHVFIIGAYRDNEVDSTHPVALLVDALELEPGLNVETITLAPLAVSHVQLLVADSLGMVEHEVAPLAELVERRTGGNPFFVRQLLKSLYRQSLVRFDPVQGRFTWHLDEIRQVASAENVVDFMLARFDDFTPATRTLLAWAACIGARFSLDTLSALSGQSVLETHQGLRPALREEFVVALSAPEFVQGALVTRHLRFLHDRTQEASYASLPEPDRMGAHLTIARRLLIDVGAAEGAEQVFDIADHLRRADPLLTSREDRLMVARWNAHASRRAFASAAYDVALGYATTAMERPPEDLWDTEPGLARYLFAQRSEVEYLCGHVHAAERFAREAIDRIHDPVDQAELYTMLVAQLTMRPDYPRAVETGREGLARLGVTLPTLDFATTTKTALAEIVLQLGDRPLATLGSLPKLADRHQRAVLRLLTALGPPCYRSHADLWGVLVAMEVRACLHHGNVASATYSYPAFGGLLMHTGGGDGRDCAALCEATLALMASQHSPTDTAVGHLMIGSSLRHWFAPLRASSLDFTNAYETGQRFGNLQYAVYGFGHNAYCRFYQSTSLAELIAEVRTSAAFAQRRKNSWGTQVTLGVLRVARWLHEVRDHTELSVEGETEDEYLASCESVRSVQAVCIYQTLKAEALLHFGQLDAAGAALLQALEREASVSTQGLFLVTQLRLLEGLLLAAAPEVLRRTPSEAHRRLHELQRTFERWAAASPANFGYAAALLAAEDARLSGDVLAAIDAYDRAMGLARTERFHSRVALIASRAAALWLAEGRPHYAEPFQTRARVAYEAWQADGVIWHREGSVRTPNAPSGAPSHGDVARSPALDLRAIARTAQVLTRSSALEDVVREVTTRVVQLSGAHRAALLLASETGLQLVADTEDPTGTVVTPPRRLDKVTTLPQAIINYVGRTLRPVQLGDGEDTALRAQDPYFADVQAASVLAVPLVFIGTLHGVLYLEHHTARQAFDDEVGRIVEFVATQAAIAVRNAVLVGRLVRERERYASFMTIAQDGMHLIDESGVLVEANDAFLRLVDRHVAAVGSLSLFEWDAEVSKGQMADVMRSLLAEPRRFQTRYRREDGGEIEVEVNAGAVTLEGRCYVLCAARDVTARREFERRLEELNRSLEASIARAVAELRTKDQLLITQSRQAAMGEMLGNIAHQWRQPLNALALVLANLRDAWQTIDVDAAATAETFERGKRLIEKMNSTITDFSDFFRPKKEKCVFRAAAKVAETVALIHASYVHAGVNLDMEFDEGALVFGLSNEYSQVVLNLLSNARQAIRAHGVVDGRVTVRLTQRPEGVALSVRDNGGGVPDAIMDKLFEPYFSTREGGTGIGLFMSRQIVEQSLGGRIEVRNVDAGAEFTVLTPAVAPHAGSAVAR